jgi:hypothetical protein
MTLTHRRRTWIYLIVLVCIAEPLLAFDYYSLVANESAHTALPTRWLAWGMLLVAAVGALALAVELRGPSRACRLVTAAIVALSLAGAANVWAFEHYNVMMEYGIWVKEKRMPAKYAPPGTGYQVPLRPPPDPQPEPSLPGE